MRQHGPAAFGCSQVDDEVALHHWFEHRTQALAEQALQAIEAQDFDAAGDAVAQLTRSCKNCHEVYKKD